MEERFGFKPEIAPSAPFPQPPYPTSGSSIYPPSLSYPIGQNPNNLYPQLDNSSFPSPPPPIQPPQSNIDHNNQAYRWIDSSAAYGSVPPTAVQGGMDADGHPIYVGRAYHEGNLIPAKVIPGKNAAYVAHDGEEHAVENFQILCQQHFEWVSCQAGTIPHGAVPGGHTSEGEPLYIGRAYHEGSQTVGKIHPSHGVCYIPFDGEEVAVEQYEALVLRL